MLMKLTIEDFHILANIHHCHVTASANCFEDIAFWPEKYGLIHKKDAAVFSKLMSLYSIQEDQFEFRCCFMWTKYNVPLN